MNRAALVVIHVSLLGILCLLAYSATVSFLSGHYVTGVLCSVASLAATWNYSVGVKT